MKKHLIPFLLLIAFASAAQVQFGNGRAFVTGAASQTALNNNVILSSAGSGSYDALNYSSWSIEIVPASGTVTAGVITFEASNDNFVATAVPLLMYDKNSQTANPVSNYTIVASTPRYFVGSTDLRYVRARISTGVTGTTTGVQAFAVFRGMEFVPNVFAVSQATAANLNVTVATVGTSTPGTGANNSNKARATATGATDTGNLTFGTALTTPGAASTSGTNQPPSLDLFNQARVIPGISGTPTVSRVTSSATNVTALAANTARKGLILFNESTSIAYIKFGATASVTSYSFQMAPGAYWELPYGPVYTGIIDAIWTVANGALQVTELP